MRYMMVLVLALLCLQPSMAVSAEKQNQENEMQSPTQKPGFSASVALGAVWIRTDSQLVVNDDNEDADLDGHDAFDKFWPLVLLDLNYTLDSGTRFYLETPMEEEALAVKLGVSQSFGAIGRLDIYLSPGFFGEVWEDPYITAGSRDATDKRDWTVGVEWDRIAGTGLKLGYAYKMSDIDEDVIGERIRELQRDGATHTIKADYGLNAGNGLIFSPGLTFDRGDSDGKANSYSGYGAGLTIIRIAPKYFFLASITYERSEYDETHPIFDKTREETIYGGFSLLTWYNPAGLDRWFITGGLGYFHSDANIDFYDASTTLTFLSIGYKFH